MNKRNAQQGDSRNVAAFRETSQQVKFSYLKFLTTFIPKPWFIERFQI
jgi:hypothetical protein